MNIGTLYRYELKKIFKRKLTWVMLALFLIITVFSLLSDLIGNSYVNGIPYLSHYEIFLLDRKYERALTGRKIDQKLIDEMVRGYEKLSRVTDLAGNTPTDEDRIAINEASEAYVRPYKSVHDFLDNASPFSAEEIESGAVSEADFYENRMNRLQEYWQDFCLTDAEKAFLTQKEQALEKPFTFAYKEGYYVLFNAVYTIGIFLLLLIVVCLSGLFPEEHLRRTDQLLLCAKNGKAPLYLAKIMAGVTFCIGISTFISVFAYVLVFCVYGADGFQSAFQLIYYLFSFSLTAGQAALICYGIIIVTAALTGLIVMLVSELLRNSTATLAVCAGFLILGLFLNIPEQYRVLSQIWDYLPNCFLAVWNIFDFRLVRVFGRFLPAWQIVPVIYLLAGGAIIAAGKPIYEKYQVS